MILKYLTSDHAQTYMAYGHIGLAEMAEAVRKEQEGDTRGFEPPEHVWFRAVPNREEGGHIYHEAEPRSRGAFAATIMARPW